MAPTEHIINLLLNEANAARQSGRLDVAAQRLATARDHAPDNAMVLNASGMHMLATRDFAAAKSYFAAAAAADPKAPALFVNLAKACRGLGDDNGERSSLKAALALDRRDFIALLRLAELDERQGYHIEAALSWSGIVQMAASISEPPPLVIDALQRGTAYLLKHNADLSKRVNEKLGKKLEAMGTNARRINACIDHSLGRRQIYSNHCDGVHFPFLPADEFFDRCHFPWLAELEKHTSVIRREAQALLDSRNAAIRPYVQLEPGTPDNKWSALDKSEDWSACFLWEYGERNDEICAQCPETAAAMSAIPHNRILGKAPTVFFSILKPKSHIPAHTGVTNTRAIIHLPLVVPNGCRFRVGGDTRTWREGEAFAFDDTIEHEAWNDSDEHRIVLIFDVWNPYMTATECEMVADFLTLTGDVADA